MTLAAARRFTCVGCHNHFSVTSGTIFASRKLSFTDPLAAIVIFVNGAKGVSALQVSRDLDVQYKTAFVLSHKLREAMALEQAGRQLNGVVRSTAATLVATFALKTAKSTARTAAWNRTCQASATASSSCVSAGRSLPFVVRNEGDAVPFVRDHVGTLATINADEGSGWDALHAGWDTRQVNHSVAFLDEGVCTNQAESYFSRLRRMEIGTHQHIEGPYLNASAGEASWHEYNRRVPNGDQAALVGRSAMGSPVSRGWAGYWQRAGQ